MREASHKNMLRLDRIILMVSIEGIYTEEQCK
jgi:hypothetical protein